MMGTPPPLPASPVRAPAARLSPAARSPLAAADSAQLVKEMSREEVSQSLRSRRDLTLQEADSIADLIDAARGRMLSRSEIR